MPIFGMAVYTWVVSIYNKEVVQIEWSGGEHIEDKKIP
jgi:hypothetical protein